MNFSSPVVLTDPWQSRQVGSDASIAKIAEDVAVAAWNSPTPDYDYNRQPLHLAAIRYSDDGPLVGPTLNPTEPTMTRVAAVVSGRDGEVWLVCEDSNARTIRIGRVEIDLNSLELTLVWKYALPMRWTGYSTLVEIWPEEDRLILSTGNGSLASTKQYWVHLVDLTTGAVIQSVEGPLYDPELTTNTDTSLPRDIALHRSSGTLLAAGERYNRGVGSTSSALWTLQVTPSGFGSWVSLGEFPRMYDYYWYGIRWVKLVAVPDGWNALFASTYWSSAALWYHIALDGTVSSYYDETGSPYLTASGPNGSDYGYSRSFDLIYDDSRDASIATYIDSGWDRRGFMLHMAPGADTEVLKPERLPKSEKISNYATTARIAQVGVDRYVFLFAGTGLTKPRGAEWSDKFDHLVWVGSETVTPVDFGGQNGETRRAFRRV